MSTATPDATITSYTQNDSAIQYLYGIDCRLGYNDFYYGVNDHTINNNTLPWQGGSSMFKFLNTYPNRDANFPPLNENDRSFYFRKAKKINIFDSYPLPESGVTSGIEILSCVIDTDDLSEVVSDLQVHYSVYTATYSFIQNIDIPLNLSPNTGLKRIDVPVGLYNLSSYLTSSNDSTYVICYIADSQIYNVYTEIRLFEYDRSCSIYDPKLFLFKNSLGAWDFWTFTQDTKKTKTTTRNEYKQEIPFGDFLNVGGVYYRGQNIYSGKIQENYIVNTNWVSEVEYEYLSELVESSDAYIMVKRNDQYLPYPVPIIITDTNYEIKTALRDQLFNMTMNYKMSVDTPMQGGQ
jgi:hypothetical protein